MQTIVADIDVWNLDQFHVASDASVVPPIEKLSRHRIGMTFVIYLHNDHVFTFLQQFANVEVEGCEAPYVMAQLVTVQPHVAVVVYSAEVEEEEG